MTSLPAPTRQRRSTSAPPMNWPFTAPLTAGQSWLRVPLSTDYIGGVTSLALDEAQRILYAGTDTAGIFRLRDVGSSMILSGHELLGEPVVELVADSSGNGLAFARTAETLYRADNFGLEWAPVENLGSSPTALALANTTPATIYVRYG